MLDETESQDNASVNDVLGDDLKFNEKTIEGILKRYFKNEKTKISKEALKLIAEMARVHVVEILMRSATEAKTTAEPEVTDEHLEKVLPQLLLDFH